MKPLVSLGLVAGLLAGCEAEGTPDANKTAGAISGADKVAASDNPQCKMFSADEIAGFAGEGVKPGQTGAAGMGCNWLASDGSGVVIVTVAPAEYHVETSEAPGYRALPDIGGKGFVAGAGNSWTAATIAGDKTIIAGIDASGGSEARTIDLLKAAMAKVAG